MNHDLRLIYITTESKDEARKIGTLLVKESIATCVNIIDGMESIYSWKGTIETSTECILIAKTKSSKINSLTKRVLSLHSYDCPCIISLTINNEEGNKEYLDWLSTETVS